MFTNDVNRARQVAARLRSGRRLDVQARPGLTLPPIYTVATEQPARSGTVAIRLSPGLAAYSFTFG